MSRRSQTYAYVEIAPSSTYARKLIFVAYELVDKEMRGKALRYKPFAQLASQRIRRRIQREVVSDYHRNIQLIINTFAWVSVLVLFVVISYWAASVSELATSTWAGPVDTVTRIFNSGPFIAVVVSFAVIIGIYVLRGMWSLTNYYREQLKYQRRLFSAARRPAALWHVIEVWKLVAMHIVTLIPFIALAILTFSFFAVLLVSILFKRPLGP